jgi:DNA-binding Lrp family transcriptional regulator
MPSDLYDEIDLKILHALQLDARTPFAKLAAVIGVSDQTVARRYTRMRSTGSLRVRGKTVPSRLGHVEWVVRIRCTPDTAGAVAVALARRPDTSWISRTSGGNELVCVTSAPTPADELLLKALPRTARIIDVTAHCVLHIFFGREQGVIEKVSPLSPAQVAQLTPRPGMDRPRDIVPDAIDDRIIAALRIDGRTPIERLADQAEVSASTVQRRIAELRHQGLLYFDVDTEGSQLGRGIRTLLWLTVSPAGLSRVGEAMAGHDEVAFAAAITGPANLHASVATPNIAGLYTYLTTSLAAIPEIRAVESALVLETVKR